MTDDLTAPDTLQPAQPQRPSLLGLLFGAESGGRNITQGNIGDINNKTGDLAQGYFQITTGTWRTYAPAVGVDPALYPTALQAPYEVQARVASVIPLKQWGPNTINAIRSYYPNVNLEASLGQNVAATGGDFVANAPGNTYDSRFRIASSGYSGGGGYALQPRAPQSPLDTFAGDLGTAVADTAQKEAQPAEAAVAPAQAQAAMKDRIAPLGVQPMQVQQQPAPRTMDYYLALLKRAAPGQING